MKYSFRFLNLKEAEAKKLSDDLKQYQPRAKKRFDKRAYCVSLLLSKHIEPKVLAQAMRKHRIKKNKTDVFASLLTRKDTGTIGIPDHVNKVLRATDSILTFSFTYVG